MKTKTVWLKAKVTDTTNGYTSTKCFSVKIINDNPLFFGPYFVEVGVRDTSRVPLRETEVQILILDPENNTDSFISQL